MSNGLELLRERIQILDGVLSNHGGTKILCSQTAKDAAVEQLHQAIADSLAALAQVVAEHEAVLQQLRLNGTLKS